MYIHNPVSGLVYRFITFFICCYGIFINIMPFSLKYIVHMLSYYTIISSTICFYVLLRAIFVSIASMLSNSFAKYNSHLIFFKGLATISIVVSSISYDFILNCGNIAYTSRGIMIISNKDFIVHYLLPFLMVGDWLLFQPKGRLKWSYILSWQLYPLTYIAFILIKTYFAPDYPYYFLDIKNNGISTFFNSIFIIGILSISISTLLVAFDKILSRFENCSSNSLIK